VPEFDNSFLAEEDHSALHADALVLEVRGQTIGWRPSGLALRRAADKGEPVGALLEDLQTLFGVDLSEEKIETMSDEEIAEAAEVEGDPADFLVVIGKLLWVGALHFEPNARLDSVLRLLDAEAASQVPTEQLLQRIFPALREEDPVGKEKGGTEKGDPSAS
jgi:hypothetical protein